MKETKFLKQFGLKRSGTSFTKYIIDANCKNTLVLHNILGWKHGSVPEKIDWSGKSWGGIDYPIFSPQKRYPDLMKRLPEIKKEYKKGNLGYLLTYKHPHSWLVSLKNYLRNFKWNKETVEKFILHWNKMHTHWLAKIPNKRYLIKFEDLIQKPQKVLESISQTFNLTLEKTLVIPEQKVSPGKQERFDPSYYQDKRFYKEISSEYVNLVDSFLDKKLMKKLGYA